MRTLLSAVLVLALAAPAGAVVLSEDELAEESTELGVITRSFLFGLFGDILEPPQAAEDASPSATAIFDVRAYFVKRSPSLKIVIHQQLTAAVRSHAGFGAIPIGRGLAPPRLLPLSFDLADEPTLGITSVTDWAYVAWSRGRMTVTAGRQPITFGRGKLWRPTDVVAAFAITEVDTEYKPGADALRLDWSPSAATNLTAVVATGELEDDHDLAASLAGTTAIVRGKRSFDGGELGSLLGFVRGDAFLALDGVWDTGSFEVYGEAAAAVLTAESLASPLHEPGDLVVQGVAGATFKPHDDLTVSPELLYNGFGAAAPADYLEVALSPRVGIGQQTTLGRYYAAGIVAWEAHPLLSIGGAVLANLRDPSALISASLSYSISDNTRALLGGYLPSGQSPEALVAKSEYGLFPCFLFFELDARI